MMERGLIAELSPEKYPTGGRTLTLVTLEVREGETGGGVYVNPLFKKKLSAIIGISLCYLRHCKGSGQTTIGKRM